MAEELNEFAMAYQDSADSLTLLFIHGFPLQSAMWEFQIEDIASVARIIAPDLRGHGFSPAVPGPYLMGQLAMDCMGLLEHLAISGPVVVCGLSMGGYVALEFVRQFPDRIDGLILASTRAGADSAEGKAGRDKTAALVAAEGAAALTSMLPKLLCQTSMENKPELVEFVQDMIVNTEVDGIVGALMGMKERDDMTDFLPQITIPTLIIHGTEDALIPLREAEAMLAAIPDAELVLIENAGHLPPLEQPDEFNDAVFDFLEQFEEDDEEDD